MTKSIDMTPTQIGFAQGVFSITYALGMIFWGGVGHRFSARSLIVCGLVMTGLMRVDAVTRRVVSGVDRLPARHRLLRFRRMDRCGETDCRLVSA
ncbi:MFS transporter [Paraburkholderia sp.]|uniref:MFS transporter n=1 Tax=Paraburkholderia sp. TaxID=1926495 RepID=UPI003443F6CD